MCSHLGIKFRDLKDVPWWRIKAFMRYITQHNKDDMLQAAQNLSTKNYKQYINDQEKTQIIQRQKAIIYVPLQKYEKIHGQLEAIKYAHKFAYLYEVLEYLLKTNVEKQEYHKEKKLNNLIDETPLDDVLQILTQKYPHMLIEITELEGYENA
jgi:hypothetical protein